eukprot:g5310.t1
MVSNASSHTEVSVHHLGRAGEDRPAQPAGAVQPVPEASRGPRPCVAVLQDFVSTCASQYFPQAGDGVPHDHDCGPSREEFESSLKVEIERSVRRIAFGLPRGGASASSSSAGSSRNHAGTSLDQEQRLHAFLGDGVLDLFLSLQCVRERPDYAKLTAKQADTLRRKLLCTKTLGGSSDTPEAARAAAEKLEAEVGKKAELFAEELCSFLEWCVMDDVEMPLAGVEPALRPDGAGGSFDEKTRAITREPRMPDVTPRQPQLALPSRVGDVRLDPVWQRPQWMDAASNPSSRAATTTLALLSAAGGRLAVHTARSLGGSRGCAGVQFRTAWSAALGPATCVTAMEVVPLSPADEKGAIRGGRGGAQRPPLCRVVLGDSCGRVTVVDVPEVDPGSRTGEPGGQLRWPLPPFDAHVEPVTGVAALPDSGGTRLVTVSCDGNLRIWSWRG